MFSTKITVLKNSFSFENSSFEIKLEFKMIAFNCVKNKKFNIWKKTVHMSLRFLDWKKELCPKQMKFQNNLIKQKNEF